MKNYYITEVGSKVKIFDEKSIDLSYECIIEIFITDLPKCERLDLDHNRLESVDLNLPKCKTLYLNSNKLKSVDLNLPKCSTLRLEDNNLKSVELNLPVCSDLRLDHNRLKLVDLNLPKCVRLDLDYNNLKSVKLYLPECETLYLDHNNLKSVDLDLPKCNRLDLYNNKLKSVELNLPECNILYLYNNNNNSLKSVNIDLPKCIHLHSDLIKFIQSSGDVVIGFDGVPTIVESEKKLGEFTIYKGRYKVGNNREVYVASRGEYSAHGDTMKEAIEDCNFKFLQATIDVGSYFAECKDKGLMSVSDYRLLTGACESGCKHFLESKGISSTEMKLDDAMKLLEENEPYGWEKIKELI